jgi:hypothetical protein
MVNMQQRLFPLGFAVHSGNELSIP